MTLLNTSTWTQLVLTIAAYSAGVLLYQRSRKHPITHPVLVSLAVILGTLTLTQTPLDSYQAANQFFSQWTGPATVALALPLQRLCQHTRSSLMGLLSISSAMVLGGLSFTAVTSILMALPTADLWALSMKSASVPFALGVSAQISSSTEWTVLAVFCTGIPTAVFGPWAMGKLRVYDRRAVGLTLGLTGHAFGLARASELGDEALGFATLGMVLSGCMLSLIIPMAHHALIQ